MMDEKNCFNEYIVSRDFLREHKREHYDLKGDEVIFSSDPYVTFGDIYDNATPVRHGEWKLIHIGHGHLWECNVCNKNEIRASDYCPNCGAKMDGEGRT